MSRIEDACPVGGDERESSARIRLLNDTLRRTHEGGMIVVTAGVWRLGSQFVAQALHAIAKFDDFRTANDPYGEHDFGRLVIASTPILFKIDYYDRSLRLSSGDPSDPLITRRVMTIMHASEY